MRLARRSTSGSLGVNTCLLHYHLLCYAITSTSLQDCHTCAVSSCKRTNSLEDLALPRRTVGVLPVYNVFPIRLGSSYAKSVRRAAAAAQTECRAIACEIPMRPKAKGGAASRRRVLRTEVGLTPISRFHQTCHAATTV